MVDFGKLVYESFNRLQLSIVVCNHYSTKKNMIKNQSLILLFKFQNLSIKQLIH